MLNPIFLPSNIGTASTNYTERRNGQERGKGGSHYLCAGGGNFLGVEVEPNPFLMTARRMASFTYSYSMKQIPKPNIVDIFLFITFIFLLSIPFLLYVLFLDNPLLLFLDNPLLYPPNSGI